VNVETPHDAVIPATHDEGETMAKTKAKGKPKTQKKVPFGGYAVCFKGCTDTLESLFCSAPIPPAGMTKRLWEYVKRHRLATKG
jgi:hypothetical protein